MLREVYRFNTAICKTTDDRVTLNKLRAYSTKLRKIFFLGEKLLGTISLQLS